MLKHTGHCFCLTPLQLWVEFLSLIFFYIEGESPGLDEPGRGDKARSLVSASCFPDLDPVPALQLPLVDLLPLDISPAQWRQF